MGTCTDQSELTGPQSKEHTQTDWGQDKPIGGIYPKLNVSNPGGWDGEVGKEVVSSHEAHAPPFPKRLTNPSPTDLPARKKHNAVPLQLLNVCPSGCAMPQLHSST